MSKVMVIDDEPIIPMMLEDIFKSAGYEVVTLFDSRDALDAIAKEMPDLVILDWRMPGLSGIEVCKALKSDPRLSHIPVFMLTAKGRVEDEDMGLRCGVNKYITKPFSPSVLLELVQTELGGGRGHPGPGFPGGMGFGPGGPMA